MTIGIGKKGQRDRRYAATASVILANISRKRMVGVKDIVGPLRFPYLVDARLDAIARMREAKIPLGHIAKSMNRDDSTISYHVYGAIKRRRAAERSRRSIPHSPANMLWTAS